jgi:tetratricopeptide (TPR) repeat protein
MPKMRKTPSVPKVAGLALLIAIATALPPALHAGYAEGVEAFQARDFERAVVEFRGVTEAQPEYAAGHLMLGRALIERGDYPAAVSSLERAAALEPEAATHAYFLGRARLAAGRPGDALEALGRHSLGEVPEGVRPAYAAALAKAAEESGGAAGLEALEAAVAEEDGSAALWVALARLHREAGRPGEAFAASERAFGLESGQAALGRMAVYNAFAAAQAADGAEDSEERRSWYQRGAEVAGRLAEAHPEPESWSLLGEARMGAGDCEGAVEAFRRADPEDPVTRYYLGSCSLRLGDAEGALAELRAALELAPDAETVRRIHAGLGAAHRHGGDFERAAEAYREAGDAEKVAEMEELAAAADINEGIDAQRARCRERQGDLEGLISEHRDLAGTPEFQALRDAWHALRLECSDVMEIPAFPEGD